MKPLFTVTLLLCILFAVSGCGPAFLPGPTSKTVFTSDIVGTWQYPADYGETTVTIEFKADHSFVQTIIPAPPAPHQIHTGTWALDHNAPQLTLLKPVFGDSTQPWILEAASWWMIDSVRNPDLSVSICGAADDRDPDSCFEMKKLP
ncbi:hypothetical protein P3T73_09420 [Kiritimatiellota bacterium B12222]|nr:hypothetical protein P3T73_09420 [Kiritimatiellota bacterium B12222]